MSAADKQQHAQRRSADPCFTLKVAHASFFQQAEVWPGVKNSKYDANSLLRCSFSLLQYTDLLCVGSEGGAELQRHKRTKVWMKV